MTDPGECHCGYPFPAFVVHLATTGTPSEWISVKMQCPACDCWRELVLSFRGQIIAGTKPHAATNAKGGSA